MSFDSFCKVLAFVFCVCYNISVEKSALREGAMNDRRNATGGFDFFISFSNEDVEVVTSLVQKMEACGAVCWFQGKDSRAEFAEAIMEGIESAKAFVVFVSPASANSYFVMNEINHAVAWKLKNENYFILPVFIGKEAPDLADPAYKKINFYLGRLNMLFASQFESEEELVCKIFDQTGFETGDRLHQSLYHSSEIETKRLRAQNEILHNFSKEFFEKMLRPEDIVLDVGCADGDNIALRLSGLQYRFLLGVDIEKKQVERANRNHGSEKDKFITCDILGEEFESILSDYLKEKGASGFDLIHISAVLMHLTEPVLLLARLRRFLNNTGYLFIQDEDDGANLVYPNSKFFDLAFRIWADSKESGDRHCARKIPSYLKEAGYSSVSLAKCGVSNPGMDAGESSAFWDIYFNHYLWLGAEENVFYNPSRTNKMLEEYRAEYEKYKAEYDAGNIFIQLGFLFFIAQK